MDSIVLKTIFHKSLTVEKWASYSFEQQLLMIGSEFARAKSLSEKSDFIEVANCIERAIELLCLTVYDPKWQPKLRELLRFKEITGEYYFYRLQDKEFGVLLYKTLLEWNGNTAKVAI